MVETLKVVTETTVITTTTTVTEEKYKVVAPETMQETFMTDSEDEGGTLTWILLFLNILFYFVSSTKASCLIRYLFYVNKKYVVYGEFV